MENYKKIKTIGRGAFGVVYLCERLSDHFKLVIKEIPTDQLSSEDRQVSLNEAKVQSMLSHPNIIAYYDSFLEEKHMIIVMEYAEGGTLYDYLISRNGLLLSEKTVLKFFCQLLMALHHVHSQSILHRDLKSQNILLDKSKCFVKIADFGISKILCTKSKALTVVGTPHYISPELCEGKPYCQKSDIWALGCILYELLTLRRPFEADNLSALVMKIMKGDYESVHKDYSKDIKQLLSSMLQKDPSNRLNIPQILAQPFIVPTFFEMFSEVGCISPSLRVSSCTRLSGDLSANAANRASSNNKVVSPKKLLNAWFIGSSMLSPKAFPISSAFQSLNLARILINKIKQELQMSLYDSDHSMTDVFNGIFDERPKCFSSSHCEKLSIKDFSDYCTGSGFAVCLSKNQVVSTVGKVATGCLGYNTVLDVSEPKIVKTLFGHGVVSVDCGPRHIIGVSEHNEVFAWGYGDKGCLGLNKVEYQIKPKIVPIKQKCKISQVFCGLDCSFAITDEGSVLACGSNRHNKLGMDTEDGLSVDEVRSFTLVNSAPLPSLRVTHIAPGNSHTAVLTEDGKICTFGSNRYGQLGWGDTKLTHNMPGFIDVDASITMLASGDFFTMALSSDHECWLWGLGPKVMHSKNLVSLVKINHLSFLNGEKIILIAAHEKDVALITESDDK